MNYHQKLIAYMECKCKVCKKNWAKELADLNPYLFGEG